ncbi:MAG: glycosyltransferase [Desulfobacteraceae bacterium]|nr:glycosyltransferase [Desulfobacteraceae bacterium]
MERIDMPGIEVHYVPWKGNMLIRGLRFLNRATSLMKDKPDIVFIKYFKVVSLALRLIKPNFRYILDIRTGSVKANSVRRTMQDIRLGFEARFFKNITIISESLSKRLNLAHKAHVLPLGADIISNVNKTFDEIKLLYVGTLSNRNMEVTLHGLKKFCDEFSDSVSVVYTIIGSGPNNEEKRLKNIVDYYGLSDVITIKGRIPHNQLKPYFDSHNIGISYIPMTEYFDVQPPTKTFEYLLSGMAVIATRTSENAKIVNEKDGVLINDSADEFYEGLKEIYDKKNSFDSREIRNSNLKYTWKNIVNNNLKPYLDKLA